MSTDENPRSAKLDASGIMTAGKETVTNFNADKIKIRKNNTRWLQIMFRILHVYSEVKSKVSVGCKA